MSDNKEKISAYLDDALSVDELDALSKADQVSGQASGHGMELGAASRYQMIGDALRGQLDDASMIDVRMQVQEAVRNEKMDASEVIDRQSNKDKSIFESEQGLVSWLGSALFGSSRSNLSWYRPLGGLAVAASVAMIMVFTVTDEELVSDKSRLVAENAIERAPVISVPVANVSDTAFETGEIKTRNLLTQPYPNLDSYLDEHAEFAAQDTMQGRMPYARAVSYKPE